MDPKVGAAAAQCACDGALLQPASSCMWAPRLVFAQPAAQSSSLVVARICQAQVEPIQRCCPGRWTLRHLQRQGSEHPPVGHTQNAHRAPGCLHPPASQWLVRHLPTRL